ncbi:glutathione S-transferase family protein [Pleionea litopenaei]|uniref:Glutathione S-transferase family protein n=1 Tax=Pleionea litopenaei TaxID=3070815 RepID=A0AA51X6Y7_9GAMM|nr:glutathione S-transferase family protein [Pleionea sp. HL-JVS1]WMS87354.1 glutathione S-transferase family protein [Pleionea sp. HL-JVS1]
MSLVDNPNCALTLYTNPMSRGQIARWMLEETELEYQQVILEYEQSMKSAEYLSINPMGKVPAISHEGKVITECAAICAYLADITTNITLAPAIADRADYYRWLFFAAGPLEAAIVNRSLGVEVSAEKQRMVGYGQYDMVVDVLAKKLSESDYICGSHFTAADVYIGSHVIWGTLFGSLPERSEFSDYAARLTNRSAYLRAKSIDDQLIQARENS